ncbi:MAG: hypothetical protein H0T84_03325 [Tatlockia sp.]|nr:hypothetical protein [Tatlockia sp.]
MFALEFHGDSQVKSIIVSGRYVSLFLPEQEVENCLNRNSFNNYWVFDEENNDTALLLLLPNLVNQENLKHLLEQIAEEDLNQGDKDKILTSFQQFTTTPSLNYLSYLIQPYLDILEINQEVIESESHFFKDAMPVYVNSSADFKSLIEAGDLPATSKINGIDLDTKQLLTEYTAFFLHIKDILKNLHEYIQILSGQKNSIPKEQLIAELERLFHLASLTPFPDFKSLMPSLQEELANNLPFTGEKLNDLYKLLAEQLSLHLGIDNLGFKPQMFPSPSTKKYIVVDLENKTYANNTPKHLKTKPQQGKPDEPEFTPIKKLDFSSLNDEQFVKTKFSPQKRKPVKISQPQNLDSNLPEVDQSKVSPTINPDSNNASQFLIGDSGHLHQDTNEISIQEENNNLIDSNLPEVEQTKVSPTIKPDSNNASQFLIGDSGHLHQDTNEISIQEENNNPLRKATLNDPILRECLNYQLQLLTDEVVSDVLALQKFHQIKLLPKNHPDFDQDYNNSLDRFYERALIIRLSNIPIKAQANEIAKVANEEFQPRHSTRRLIADVLMVISVLFGGLGLVIMLGRVCTNRTLFFSSAITDREQDLRAELRESESIDELETNARLFQTILV